MDWPGRITAVVFLPGCSFDCQWCHNRKLLDPSADLQDYSLQYVVKKIKELSDFVDGVTISGGEPAIDPDLPDIIRQLRKIAPVKLDTNGYQPEMLRDLFREGLLEGISMDVKAPLNSEHYSRVVSVPVDIEKIKQSIELILKAGIWYEFRTTVIPGLLNDSDIQLIQQQLKNLAGGSLNRPLKIQTYKEPV